MTAAVPRKTKWPPPIPELKPGEPFVLIENPRTGGRGFDQNQEIDRSGEILDGSTEHNDGLLFANPREIIACETPNQVPAALARLDAARAVGYSVAGYIAYEAASVGESLIVRESSGAGQSSSEFPLVYMLVCDRPFPVCIDRFLREQIEANGPADLRDYSLAAHEVPDERGRFFAAMRTIKEHLAAGECYQINYSQTSTFAFSGNIPALYQRLRRLQPTAYSALIVPGLAEAADLSADHKPRAVLSLSPELFFQFGRARKAESEDYLLETRPMKGTAPRYSDPELDRESRDSLARDPKILAEHRMIVDLLRNDLGIHARPGGVSLPEMLTLESHDTVHQMTTLVRARLHADQNRRLFRTVFPAVFPCGSITGAPKLAARKIIQQLETQPRGVYTGAIGYATPEAARFNVAIRTLTIDAGGAGSAAIAKYGSGCGIVWDSEPEAEWEEYRLKQAFLRPALDDFALIETMVFDGTRIGLLREHLTRLRASALHFHIDLDFQALLVPLNAFQSDHAGETRRVRLTVDRRGEFALEHSEWPHRFRNLHRDLSVDWLGTGPLQEFMLASEAEPQSIRLAAERVYSGDPFRRHKTTERGIYDAELGATRAAGFADSLFLNERGEVVESTIANLLIHTPRDEWLTPAVDCGALPGVFLAALDHRYSERVQRVRISLEEARAAGQWYLVNSLRGAWPVELAASNSTVR